MLHSDIDAFIASDPANLERFVAVSSVSFLCYRFASLLFFLSSHRRASRNRIKVLSNIYILDCRESMKLLCPSNLLV